MLNTLSVKTLWTYFALAFICMAGLAYINFLPGVVSALAGGVGFSEVEAGQIVAVNGYGGLVGSVVAIFLVRRVNWKTAVATCLTLLTLMDSATAWIEGYSIMLAWRFLAGILGGLSLGVVFSVLARLDNPDRAFGTLLFVQFSIGSLVVYLLPGLEALINAYAVFYMMASIALLSIVFIALLPRLNLSKELSRRPQPLFGEYRNAFLLLAAIMLYQIAASAIWAYVGLIGLAAGIAAERASSYIAITGLLGLLGAMLPVVTGSRLGRLSWVVTGVALSLMAALLLDFAQHATLYVSAMALLFFAWPAVQAYLLAVTAEIDGSGRLATMAAVVSFVGLATGPLLASSLLDKGSYSLMLYSCALLFVLSYLLLLKPVQAYERSALAVLPTNYPA